MQRVRPRSLQPSAGGGTRDEAHGRAHARAESGGAAQPDVFGNMDVSVKLL